MNGTSHSNPVLLWMSLLAALQVFSGASALTDLIGPKFAGIFTLAIAAAQIGIQFYVRGQVTPYQDVISKVASDGTAIAGPAHTAPTGTPVEGPPEPEPIKPPAKKATRSRRDRGHMDAAMLVALLVIATVAVVLGGLILRNIH